MIKVYYIVLAIIVCLVGWLVTDFIQNNAEARDILTSINNSGAAVKDAPVMPPPPPPLPSGDLGSIFKPTIEPPPSLAPANQAAAFNYIVTATIIEPSGPVAFIINPTRNEERICKVGDRLDEWEIIEIVHESVTLKDKNGNIRTIQVQKPWGSAKLERSGKIEMPAQIPNIPGAEDMYRKIMEGKETNEVVEQYIDAMAKTLPPAFIRDFIKQNTGLAEDDIPKDDTKLGEYGKNIFRLIQGEQSVPAQGQTVENVSFTLRVNPDNSPIAPQSAFKPGDRRIYACFQNQGALKGLSKVVHRWTNKSTKEAIKLETKPIDPAAPYNFIWVEKKDGWPVGDYEVELLKTQTFEKIGSGKFTIVP